jgi:hypothetical protein
VTKNAGATYWIPTENEWYKAAYYKGGGTNSGYWYYPTQQSSSGTPSSTLSTTGTNNANETNGVSSDPVNQLTPVGYFQGSPGPYGTFDMGGDVYEWTEGVGSLAAWGGTINGYCVRGGCWNDYYANCTKTYEPFNDPTGVWANHGFRIAAAALSPSLGRGDANGDGKVDINDLTIVLTNFGQTGCVWSQGCMDGDPTGTVDINDLTIVLTNFGTTYGVGLAAVPEPSALVLISLGVVSLVACARRRRR